MRPTTCFILLWQTYLCFAQPPSDFKFQSISTAQGLSQSSAYMVVQDHWGYIWAGPQGGMNRYDGHGVKKFEPIASGGLPEAPNANGDVFDHKQVQEIIEKNGFKDARCVKNEQVPAVDMWLYGEKNPDDTKTPVIKKINE
jgi:ligand-binding sensor domain-containing protein